MWGLWSRGLRGEFLELIVTDGWIKAKQRAGRPCCRCLMAIISAY